MDHPLIDLINAKIAEAEAEGAFDNLSGAGKPLPECDDPENALIRAYLALLDSTMMRDTPPHQILSAAYRVQSEFD